MVDVRVPALRRRVIQVARCLEECAVEVARSLVEPLVREAEVEVEPALRSSVPRAQRLRAAALARILLDLHHAGWKITIEEAQIYAIAPNFEHRDNVSLDAAKEEVRRTMQARVREQVADPRAWRLAARVEPRVRAVIAEGGLLADALAEHGPAAVRPVLEPARVADGEDSTTGLLRYDLFRYFRFLWNFPFGDVPGRTLPFLIRDAGQPGRPICGLMCFASPLLRLTSRDDDLGLTPAWLEAIVAGLDVTASAGAGTLVQHLQGHFEALLAALDQRRAVEGVGLPPTRILDDLAELLGVAGATDASGLARRLASFGEIEMERRKRRACQGLVEDLRDDLLAAVARIDSTAFGIDPEALLADPSRHVATLEQMAKDADRRWRESRKVAPDASEDGIEEEEEGPQDADPEDALLYAKKRARQLTALMKGWAGLKPLAALAAHPGSDLLAELREATSRRRAPWLDSERRVLTGGTGMNRGLTEALLQRKVHLAATQVVDVAVCGAIPPYNDLLLGKLAALLALSREAAAAYFDAYSGRASQIQSKMASGSYTRRADLVALTTTSFYAVGSSQYSRIRLPPEQGGLRWAEVGTSRGNGTLHFSGEACKLLGQLLLVEKGHNLITSTFGEGPSERLRKLRDGLSLLRLPADELLRHGMERLVYVAALTPATRPGVRSERAPHHESGPTIDSLAAFWRERWLTARLKDPARIAKLRAFDQTSLLLSSRFPEELAIGMDIATTQGEAQ
jgi:hypothetical protein